MLKTYEVTLRITTDAADSPAMWSWRKLLNIDDSSRTVWVVNQVEIEREAYKTETLSYYTLDEQD